MGIMTTRKKVEVISMRRSKNILTDHEMELVQLLMSECKNTGDIQSKLKRLFAGIVTQLDKEEKVW